jgi:dsDNA-binding SOS-regulon protein
MHRAKLLTGVLSFVNDLRDHLVKRNQDRLRNLLDQLLTFEAVKEVDLHDKVAKAMQNVLVLVRKVPLGYKLYHEDLVCQFLSDHRERLSIVLAQLEEAVGRCG